MLLAQTSFLGDVVLTTPLWRALRDAFPEAEIWWLTRPDAAPLVAPLAGRDRVLVFDKRGADGGLSGLRAVAARLRALRFDAAIAVQRSLRTAATLALAAIPERVGFAGAPGSPLYQHRVPQRGAHARDRLLALAEPFGVRPVPAPLPALEIDPAAASAVATRLQAAGVADGERLLVIAPGSAWETKRWPAERFAEAACALVPQDLHRVVVVGTSADGTHAASIAAALGRSSPGAPATLDLTGRTSTAELVATLARAALVLANDSAPAHVAAALRRPVVVPFGPTVPAQGFAPLGPSVRIVERELSCRPCSRHGDRFCPIGTHECLAELPADAAVVAARALLADAEPGRAAAASERRESVLS
ncbi:MAG: lipopolysaccharide heptosyltransferase II [Thermodesulfobacteriota bacterium]